MSRAGKRIGARKKGKRVLGGRRREAFLPEGEEDEEDGGGENNIFNVDPMRHLRENYHNPDSVISYMSPGNLYKIYQGRLYMKDIKKYLTSSESYTLTRRTRRPEMYNDTLAWYPYEIIQCDLIQIDSLSEYNEGIKYLLCSLDCYSRHLNIEALENKSCAKVTKALEKIIQRLPSVPRIVSSDRGK